MKRGTDALNLQKQVILAATPLLFQSAYVWLRAGRHCASTPITSNCNSTENLSFREAFLMLVAPTLWKWVQFASGTNLSPYDPNATDLGYRVHNDGCTGSGWHVTIQTRTFINYPDHAKSPSDASRHQTAVFSASSSHAPVA